MTRSFNIAKIAQRTRKRETNLARGRRQPAMNENPFVGVEIILPRSLEEGTTQHVIRYATKETEDKMTERMTTRVVMAFLFRAHKPSLNNSPCKHINGLIMVALHQTLIDFSGQRAGSLQADTYIYILYYFRSAFFQ